MGLGQPDTDATVDRFWCPQEGSYSVDALGWLADPTATGWLGPVQSGTVQPTTGLVDHRCLVLLGEPGIGKSTTLRPGGPLMRPDHNERHRRVDLADFASEDRLLRTVFESSEIAEWSASSDTLSLVLDSFDEAQTRIPTLSRILRSYLQQWPCERLVLRLACRTSEWPAALAADLEQIYGRGFACYEMLPLRRQDVAAFLPDGMAPQGFLEAVEAANAVPLAARPLTLRLLAQIFARTGGLPERASELYEQGLFAICDEVDDHRRAAGGLGDLSPIERMAIAARLAAMSVFGARPTVWTGVDASAEPADLTLSNCGSGPEPITGTTASVTVTAFGVRDTLATGLFTGRGPERLGWAHATFADFLAARWVTSHNLDDRQVRSLLCAPDGRIFPQVQRVAAWTVAIAPDQYGWLAEQDPESFLVDIAIPEPRLRAAVVEGLCELAAAERLVYRFDRHLRGLRHEGLHDQLERRLSDPSAAVVDLAIDIATHAQVVTLVPRLCEIALATENTADIRVSASWAVYLLAGDEPTDALLPLTAVPDHRDVDQFADHRADDLRGAALLASWPHALSTAEAFDVITTPVAQNYLSIYTDFLRRLAVALTEDDTPSAVEWLKRLGDDADDKRLARLVNGVVRLALAHPEEPGSLDAIGALTKRRAENFQPLLLDDYETSTELPAQDARRRVVLHVLADATESVALNLTDRMSAQGVGLIGADDFAWVVDQYTIADGQLRENLGRLIQWTFRFDHPVHADIVLSLPPEDPIVADLLTQWVTPVRLDSPEAEERRRQWNQVSSRRRKPSPPPDAHVNDRIDELVLLAQAGDMASYWQAARLVTVRPGTDRYMDEFQPDLTKHPRWEQLSPSTRDGLVAMAPAYLRGGVCDPDRWLGKNLNYFPAQAGYRALLLRLRHDRDGLVAFGGDVWRRWAPILVGWTVTANGAQWEDKEDLLSFALPHARTDLTDAALALVRAAADAGRAPFLRNELGHLWTPELADVLVDLLRTGVPVDTRHELLDVLVSNDPDRARPLLLDWVSETAIGGDEDRAMEAARLLLSDDAAAAWPVLEALMRDRPAFMEQVMLGTPGAYERPVPPVSPSRIADLYLWMVERFPMHEDPTFVDAHWVGPREAIGRWRDELLESLRRSGTPDAVDAVRRTAAALPEARWLQRTQAGAENALREALWSPLSLAELARLAADRRARLIRSTGQLLDETVLAFHKIQDRLQGDTPDAPLLWDTYARRPKSEDEISDYLRNQLNTLLGDRAVIVNREVQIRPSTRGVGERSDLRIDAVTTLPAAGPSPVFTVVGEVKGCWHRDVATAIQDQLVGRYMTDVGTPHGIYVVVWFDVDSWDDADRRRQVTNGRDRAKTLAALENQAALLRERGITVAVVFLDASARRSQP